MNSNQKLSYAIAAILSGSAAGLVQAAPAAATDTEASDAIQEITVTAQRRTENIQNVPIAIQALTAETLEKLSVSTFDDYVRYLPNVTVASNGPGQNNIFMRGLSVGAAGSQSSGTIGGFPNVAIYLDEQSGQLPARNLDVYAADLERIEVLEGPQGTLFGAGAQAGVVRYITNKPKINVTEGSVEAGYGITAHGDPNTDLTAVINLPLIADHLAIRAVIYNDRRGGYIDNVPGTFTRKDTDLGIYYANNPGGGVPANAPVINNNAIAAKDINPVTYTGTRFELLYQINDDWNVLLTQSYQNMDSQGVFYQMPNASDGAPLQSLGSDAVQQCLRQGQVREHGVDRQRQTRRHEDWSIRAATWCAMSPRWPTTPTTPAAYLPTTTSATVRGPDMPFRTRTLPAMGTRI